VCARFSLITRITQRDGGRVRTRRVSCKGSRTRVPGLAVSRRPGRWMSPGWHPSPRSPVVSGHQARQPGRTRVRPRAPAASGTPGRGSCSPPPLWPVTSFTIAVTATCGAHDGEDASAATIQEDPAGRLAEVPAVLGPGSPRQHCL